MKSEKLDHIKSDDRRNDLRAAHWAVSALLAIAVLYATTII